MDGTRYYQLLHHGKGKRYPPKRLAHLNNGTKAITLESPREGGAVTNGILSNDETGGGARRMFVKDRRRYHWRTSMHATEPKATEADLEH